MSEERRYLKAETSEPDREHYEGRIKFRVNALDVEVNEHPELLYQVSKRAALAQSRADYLKDELKRTEAEAYLEIRAHAREKKLSEAEVSARVETIQDVEKGKVRLRKAQEEAALWAALHQAWIQRGYALKDYCQLTIANYTTDTTVRSTGARVSDANYEQRRQVINDSRRLRERLQNDG